MNNEANKRMFELVFPDKCFHIPDGTYVVGDARFPCAGKCGEWIEVERNDKGEYTFNPNFWSSELPDNLRVAMVTAAREKFGRFDTGTALMELTDEGGLHYNPNLDNGHMSDFMALPAPVIAEAIDRLIQENS